MIRNVSKDIISSHTISAQMSASVSRRSVLKGMAFGAAAVVVSRLVTASAFAAEAEGGKVLILYFSHSGNTRQLAGMIQERTGGDIVELKTVKPYPEAYDAVVDVAKKEQQADARPEVSTVLSDLDAYETVFIGYPNWWGTIPMPFFTLLERYPLGQKTVIPFCTHEGSRFGRSESDLRKLCPQARFLEGFEVRGSRVARAGEDVDDWLKNLGLMKTR